MLQFLAERRLRRACPHPEHRVFLVVRRPWLTALTSRPSWAPWCEECRHFIAATDRCRHCGAGPDADGDHSCSCPNRDEDCPDHLDRGGEGVAGGATD